MVDRAQKNQNILSASFDYLFLVLTCDADMIKMGRSGDDQIGTAESASAASVV